MHMRGLQNTEARRLLRISKAILVKNLLILKKYSFYTRKKIYKLSETNNDACLSINCFSKFVGTFFFKNFCYLYWWWWLHNKRIGTTNVVSFLRCSIFTFDFSDKLQTEMKTLKKSITNQFNFGKWWRTWNYRFTYIENCVCFLCLMSWNKIPFDLDCSIRSIVR